MTVRDALARITLIQIPAEALPVVRPAAEALAAFSRRGHRRGRTRSIPPPGRACSRSRRPRTPRQQGDLPASRIDLRLRPDGSRRPRRAAAAGCCARRRATSWT
ncbi:MAG: hypothetical protein MZV64_43150 [Ignavibacteriales bacterium]|nr:hypothetical protein [Ignavibacteriales bacterium]